MNKLKSATTNYRFRYRKAIVEMIVLIVLILLSIAVGAQPTPIPDIVPMVKNQPFPYADGVAMKTSKYGDVKEKLIRADSLRRAADLRIRALQAEILATRQAKDDLSKLSQYDAGKAAGLQAQLNLLDGELTKATAQLSLATQTINQIRLILPRRIRNLAITPEQIWTALDEYVRRLKRRPFLWSAATGGVSFVGALILSIR